MAATTAAMATATTTLLTRVLFTPTCATLPTTVLEKNLIAQRREQSRQPPVLPRTHRFLCLCHRVVWETPVRCTATAVALQACC
eukprot:5644779-Pleurochrysis_carterae.AAC.1